MASDDGENGNTEQYPDKEQEMYEGSDVQQEEDLDDQIQLAEQEQERMHRERVRMKQQQLQALQMNIDEGRSQLQQLTSLLKSASGDPDALNPVERVKLLSGKRAAVIVPVSDLRHEKVNIRAGKDDWLKNNTTRVRYKLGEPLPNYERPAKKPRVDERNNRGTSHAGDKQEDEIASGAGSDNQDDVIPKLSRNTKLIPSNWLIELAKQGIFDVKLTAEREKNLRQSILVPEMIKSVGFSGQKADTTENYILGAVQATPSEIHDARKIRAARHEEMKQNVGDLKRLATAKTLCANAIDAKTAQEREIWLRQLHETLQNTFLLAAHNLATTNREIQKEMLKVAGASKGVIANFEKEYVLGAHAENTVFGENMELAFTIVNPYRKSNTARDERRVTHSPAGRGCASRGNGHHFRGGRSRPYNPNYSPRPPFNAPWQGREQPPVSRGGSLLSSPDKIAKWSETWANWVAKPHLDQGWCSLPPSQKLEEPHTPSSPPRHEWWKEAGELEWWKGVLQEIKSKETAEREYWYETLFPHPQKHIKPGGRLMQFADNWQTMGVNKTVVEIVRDGFRCQWTASPQQDPKGLRPIVQLEKEKAILLEKMQEFVNKGAMEDCTHEFVNGCPPYHCIVSPTFMDYQESRDKWRQIGDYRGVNAQMHKVHFKMENLESTKAFMATNRYASGTDMADAFILIGLHRREHNQFILHAYAGEDGNVWAVTGTGPIHDGREGALEDSKVQWPPNHLVDRRCDKRGTKTGDPLCGLDLGSGPPGDEIAEGQTAAGSSHNQGLSTQAECPSKGGRARMLRG
ncbi:hypothetical protein DFS34DRAFT_649887 [Phlyctochytrium arcticum]|nr:hypothetical protein DFS34DRAFT_649887 [Phlyctochytrium arcticum]